MTDKHTPGPWRAVHDPSNTGIDEWKVYAPAGAIRVSIEDLDGTAEANARLIAAAPLMLEALRGLTGQYVAFVSQGAAKLPPGEREDFLNFHAERTDKAIAAIAAATGEDA